MFKEQRTDRVLEIIREEKYTTVDTLVKRLHYSPATIRRDLVYLANLGVIKKSYGGVSINAAARPYILREHDNTLAKIKICRYAEKLVNDGDTIFIDGTTTTYFLGETLLKKKDITVFTSNLKLAIFLGEHKINCYVCGGKIFDGIMLGGAYTCDLIKKNYFDIAFFAVGGIDDDGQFSVSENYWAFMPTAIAHSKKSILLCDGKKFDVQRRSFVDDISVFDAVISDEMFPERIKTKYDKVEFIFAE